MCCSCTAAQGADGHSPWRCFQNHGDVALRLWEWWGELGLDLGIWEDFSNLNDPVIQ